MSDEKQFKLCNNCDTTKPREEFPPNGYQSNGTPKYKKYCKVCDKAIREENRLSREASKPPPTAPPPPVKKTTSSASSSKSSPVALPWKRVFVEPNTTSPPPEPTPTPRPQVSEAPRILPDEDRRIHVIQDEDSPQVIEDKGIEIHPLPQKKPSASSPVRPQETASDCVIISDDQVFLGVPSESVPAPPPPTPAEQELIENFDAEEFKFELRQVLESSPTLAGVLGVTDPTLMKYTSGDMLKIYARYTRYKSRGALHQMMKVGVTSIAMAIESITTRSRTLLDWGVNLFGYANNVSADPALDGIVQEFVQDYEEDLEEYMTPEWRLGWLFFNNGIITVTGNRNALGTPVTP